MAKATAERLTELFFKEMRKRVLVNIVEMQQLSPLLTGEYEITGHSSMFSGGTYTARIENARIWGLELSHRVHDSHTLNWIGCSYYAVTTVRRLGVFQSTQLSPLDLKPARILKLKPKAREHRRKGRTPTELGASRFVL